MGESDNVQNKQAEEKPKRKKRFFKRKRFLWPLGIILLLLIAGVAGAPWWAALTAKQVLPRFDVEAGKIEPTGYSGFLVEDLVYDDKEGIRLQVNKATASSLGTFAGVAINGGKPEGQMLEVEGWTLTINTDEFVDDPAVEEEETFVVTDYRDTKDLVNMLTGYLPKATLSDGTVVFDGERINVPNVVIDGSTVSATASYPKGKLDASLVAENLERIELDLSHPALTSRSPFIINISDEGTDLNIAAEGTLLEGGIDGAATFVPGSNIPRNGSLDIEALEVPPSLHQVPDLSSVVAAVNADYEDETFHLEAGVRTVYNLQGTTVPVEVLSAAAGNMEQATLNALSVAATDSSITLAEPITVAYESITDISGVALAGMVDLQDFGIAEETQRLEFDFRFEPEEIQVAEAQIPSGQFLLNIMPLELGEQYKIERVSAEGAIDYPSLTISQFTAALGEASSARAKGAVNLETLSIDDAEVQAEILASDLAFLELGLPEFGKVTVDAQANGRQENLRHAGSIKLTRLDLPQVLPLTVDASWTGQSIKFVSLEAAAATESASAEVALDVEMRENSLALGLTGISLLRDGQPLYSLRQAAKVAIDLPIEKQPWSVEWQPIRLEKSANGASELVLATEGSLDPQALRKLNLEVRELTTEVVDGWLEQELEMPEVRVRDLVVRVAKPITDGEPVSAEVRGHLSADIPEIGTSEVRIKAASGANGIAIDQMLINIGESPLLDVTGSIADPVTWPPPSDPMAYVLDNRYDLRVVLSDNQEAWQLVNEQTGATIGSVEMTATVKGTVDEPNIDAQLTAANIKVERPDGEVPATVDSIELRATVTPKVANIDANISVRPTVENQIAEVVPLIFEGRLPLAQGQLRTLINAPTEFDYTAATVALRMEGFSLQPLALLFPEFIGQAGVVSGRITARPDKSQQFGWALQGQARLRGLQSRLLPNGTLLKDFSAEARFDGNLVEVSASGMLSGRSFEILARADLTNIQDPIFAAAIKGTKLPLLRQSDLILNSDVALTIESRTGETPLISGALVLRDGLVFKDFRDFASLGGGPSASPDSRPPYFSIDTEPLASWRLDIAIEGDRFMRVDTPAFKGVLNSDFTLTGTLEDPTLLGAVKIPRGSIIFPAATFEINQGEVSLRRDNPHEFRVHVDSQARALGYDLSLNVSGTASDPKTIYTASPPLENEAIIALITQGSLPSEGGGSTRGAQKLALYLGKGFMADFFGASSDKLRIETGQDISRQGRETINVEYELDNRWSAIGGFDKYDQYHLGLKYRLFGGRRAAEEEE